MKCSHPESPVPKHPGRSELADGRLQQRVLDDPGGYLATVPAFGFASRAIASAVGGGPAREGAGREGDDRVIVR